MKPIVGIAGYFLTKHENHLLDYDMNVVPTTVTDVFRRAGTVPFILPLSNPMDAEIYIDQIDALVLAGGADVNSLLYNEEPKPKIGKIEPERDVFEIALIKEAWKQKKPIFGICRGMQVLNVAFEGSLYQDLSYYPDLEVNHRQQTTWGAPSHTIDIAEDSWLGESSGSELLINSYHHQAVKKLADVFYPVAWSRDGLIEAFESKDSSQRVMAVQWHPEVLVDVIPESQNVIDKFVELVHANMMEKAGEIIDEF